jgi:hypothetical protein
MADAHKYQAHEVLNRVLNTAETAIQVDIVSGSEYAEDSAHTDADTGQFILGVRNDTLAALGGTDGDYVPFQMNSSGALFVEASVESGKIKSGAIASGAVASGAVASGAVASGAIASGAVASGAIASGAVASGALASGSVADGAMVTLGAKADAKSTATDTTAITAMQVLKQISASVQETATDTGTIDSDTDAIKTAVETIDNAISGTEMQVDVVAALPSGTNTVGKVEAVGDVAEDAAVSGNPVLTGGRYDATARTLDDGDAGALALDPSGALYTREYTGQYGAVYTTASSDVIVPPTGKAFVAVQMLEDTTFDSSGGLIPVSENVWFGTEHAAGDLGSGSETTAEGSGGKQISNSVTFPQGMTIFGRWSGIDVNSGSVIAYIGDY